MSQLRLSPKYCVSVPLVSLALSCASAESGRYGVGSVEIRGADDLDEHAVEACLVTFERARLEFKLGVNSPTCNQPPFDTSTPTLRLWRWPWTEWPTFNQAVFSQDKERLLRWYRARGYYAARIEEIKIDPPAAADPEASGGCDPDREDCTVNVIIVIDEGKPVIVHDVRLSGIESFDSTVAAELNEIADALRGERFDETFYDAHKRTLRDALRSRGFAAATVKGQVRIQKALRRADLDIQLNAGAPYRFGRLEVSGHGELPERLIQAAAALPRGQPYDPEVLHEVQAEVFALGAFSAVEVDEQLDDAAHEVDLEVRVTPLAPNQLRVGVGVLSGASRRTDTGELASIPQWDSHLFGKYERRHVFGTLGRLGLEERPRLIFNQSFPNFGDHAYGNILGVRFNQPGLVEARTDAFFSSTWDYGPDPFLGFKRSDILARVGLRRGFLSRHLMATLALQQDFFVVPRGADNVTSDGSETPTPYTYSFLEQDLRLDFRDSRVRPTLGAYLGLNITEAPRWAASDWAQLRLAPELRGYLPLPLDIVLATRFAVGWVRIGESSPELDVTSRQLGPSSYRLRGGGANSNRGFLPGLLGAGVQGGLRRWESSTELRFAFGTAFGLVGFFDLGDVNENPAFRFDHLNSSAGAGLRYHTLVGVLRLDVGFRIPSLQRASGAPGIEEDANTLPWSQTPGAAHFTIGESF